MRYAPALVGLVGSFVILPATVLIANRYADVESMCRTVARATRHPIGAPLVGAVVGAITAHGLYELVDEWRNQ